MCFALQIDHVLESFPSVVQAVGLWDRPIKYVLKWQDAFVSDGGRGLVGELGQGGGVPAPDHLACGRLACGCSHPACWYSRPLHEHIYAAVRKVACCLPARSSLLYQGRAAPHTCVLTHSGPKLTKLANLDLGVLRPNWSGLHFVLLTIGHIWRFTHTVGQG